jgi:hypothetical protein
VWQRVGRIRPGPRPACRKRRLMAIPPSFASFGGSVFAVRCDPCGGMKESWFAERGDVMSWYTPCNIQLWSGFPFRREVRCGPI